MIMIILEVFIFCLFCLWLTFLWSQRKYYALARKLQGPPAYPLIGCIFSFYGSIQELFEKFCYLVARYATPISFWLGPNLYIYIDRPEHVQAVLNSPQCEDKIKLYYFANELIGEGLVTSQGIKWKNHRKLLNPSFGITRLIGFMDTFNESSKILTNRLESYAKRHESVDIFNFVSNCTLDSICKTAMGVDLKLQENGNKEYSNAIFCGFELVCYRSICFWLHPDWIFKWTNVYRKTKQYSKIVYSLSSDILKERRNKIAKDDRLRESFLKELNEEEYAKKPQIFINQMLKLQMQGQDLSDDDIINESNTIIGAGNDTSATTLSFIILSMALYPEIQERLFNEIKEVFPTNDVNVEYEDLAKLNYLEMIIKESMRFYTTVPMIARKAKGEFQMGDLTIPAGVSIIIGFYSMYRNKDIWGDDADEFNPDRFLPEASKKRHPYSFLPFGGGPRICIGQKYAMMAMKTMLVHLLRKYRLTTQLKHDELKFATNVTLRLINKHIVELHLREFPTK